MDEFIPLQQSSLLILDYWWSLWTNDSVLLLSHPIWQALSIRDTAGPGPFTVFVPHTKVLNSDQRVSKKAVSFQMQPPCSAASQFLCILLQVRGWLAKGVMAQILRYHIVGCASLLYSDLTTLTNITSLQGDAIQISYVQVTWWRRGMGLNRLGSFSLFQKWNVSLPSPMHENKCSIKKKKSKKCLFSQNVQYLSAMLTLELCQPCFESSFTLQLWGLVPLFSMLARGSLLKPLLVAHKDTISKKFGSSLTIQQEPTENIFNCLFRTLCIWTIKLKLYPVMLLVQMAWFMS